MSLDKSEVRIGVAKEIGCALDDALEAAQAEAKFFEGGTSALVQACKQVQALAALVDADLDGKGEGLITDLEVAKIVKKYVTRAVTVVESGAKTAENMRLMAEGKVRALSAAVGGIKKRVDAEHLRAAEIRVRAAAGELPAEVGAKRERKLGEHPGPTVKVDRLAAELNAKPPKVTRSRKSNARGANA